MREVERSGRICWDVSGSERNAEMVIISVVCCGSTIYVEDIGGLWSVYCICTGVWVECV